MPINLHETHRYAMKPMGLLIPPNGSTGVYGYCFLFPLPTGGRRRRSCVPKGRSASSKGPRHLWMWDCAIRSLIFSWRKLWMNHQRICESIELQWFRRFKPSMIARVNVNVLPGKFRPCIQLVGSSCRPLNFVFPFPTLQYIPTQLFQLS